MVEQGVEEQGVEQDAHLNATRGHHLLEQILSQSRQVHAPCRRQELAKGASSKVTSIATVPTTPIAHQQEIPLS